MIQLNSEGAIAAPRLQKIPFRIFYSEIKTKPQLIQSDVPNLFNYFLSFGRKDKINEWFYHFFF